MFFGCGQHNHGFDIQGVCVNTEKNAYLHSFNCNSLWIKASAIEDERNVKLILLLTWCFALAGSYGKGW